MINLLQTTLVLGDGMVASNDFSSVFMLVIKIMFLVGALIYFVFALVVVRQIHVMKNTLITSFAPVIQLIGFGHLVLSALVGVFLLMIL